MFVYELGANTCWYFVCLMIVVIGTLYLDIHCWECLSSWLFMQDIINDTCLILFVLIMINVRLTLSGLGRPSTYLYEWVDDVQNYWSHCFWWVLVVVELHPFMLLVVSYRLWSRMASFLYFGILFYLELYLVEIIYVVGFILCWWHGICWEVFDSAVTLCWSYFHAWLYWWLFVGVTTISYVFNSFAWFIA